MKRKLNCILLVDDDEPTNYLSKMLLEELDCSNHIEVMQSAGEALKYLTGTKDINGKFPVPDLIFLDINMPAMNGWEFLKKYNELDQTHKGKVVVVMLTTSLNPDDRSRANQLQEISGFESKPITVGKLDSILRKHFADHF